jgi:hypothetical protein
MTENTLPPRKGASGDHETEIFRASRRRCALCFWLDGNLEEQNGQIAHLDKDRSNNKLNNLAFLCLDHHSIFDGKNSQHKNYTEKEAKLARAMLYDAIAEGKHLTYKKGDPKPQPGLATDTKTLDALTSLMAATGTIDWLRQNNFAGFSFGWDRLRGLNEWADKQGPENEFIDAELEALRKAFHSAATEFISTLGTETFPLGNSRSSVPQDWEIDEPERFHRLVTEIHDGASLVCRTYDELVRQAKRKLSA